MFAPITSRHRRRDEGFTLIELIVVIVILGILSAVVVFAVRGSGDKGKKAAVATDERIIRTALEVYCATKGHYPTPTPPGTQTPMDVLVAEKFLSSPSEYHTLQTADDLPQGNCPASPRRYLLTGPPSDQGPEGWSNATPPNKGVLAYNDHNMVQLPDGKIFTGAELFDPVKGSWAPAPHPLGYYAPLGCPNGDPCGCYWNGSVCAFDSPSAMVPLRGGPSLCGENCGKVFVHHADGAWGDFELYDGSVAAGPDGRVGKWSLARHSEQLLYMRRSTRAVQITGTAAECRHVCGDVLIAGVDAGPDGGGRAELYDPRSGAFVSITPATDSGPILTSLPRGQALAVGTNGAGASRVSKAFVFDPLAGADGAFIEVAAPASAHWAIADESAVLSDGSVIVTSNQATWQADVGGEGPLPSKQAMDVFVPSASGVGGTWNTTPACGETVQTVNTTGSTYWERYCHLLSMAGGGKIMAWSSPGRNNGDRPESPSYEGRTYVFGSVSKTWTRSADLVHKPNPDISDPSDPAYNDMPSGGILISGTACGANCGKVLAINHDRHWRSVPKILIAELWRAPAGNTTTTLLPVITTPTTIALPIQP